MDELAGLVNLIKTGGPYFISAIFISCWWLERKERQAAQTQLEQVYEKTIGIAATTGVAAEKMHSAVVALTEALRSRSP